MPADLWCLSFHPPRYRVRYRGGAALSEGGFVADANISQIARPMLEKHARSGLCQ